MTSLMEVFKKPFAEKRLLDSLMILSLRFKVLVSYIATQKYWR